MHNTRHSSSLRTTQVGSSGWAIAVLLAAAACSPCTHAGIAELVGKYPLETHHVTTEDGYINSLFRLGSIHDRLPLLAPSQHAAAMRTSRARRHLAAIAVQPHTVSQAVRLSSGYGSGKPVVVLQHGLLDSCAGFLLLGPGRGLAFLLVDAGFDVWLANSRGSTQARNHAWLDPASAAYWAFSWDDMAQYDLPAVLTYVRARTGVARVHYVAHSQGSTIALAALAFQGESIANQLGLLVLMAPVSTTRHVTSMPLQAMAAAGTEGVFSVLGVHEFLPSMQALSWLEGQLCTVQPQLCISILAAICGYRRNAVNQTQLPQFLKYTPAGSSVQNLAHWAQMVRGGRTPGRPQLTWFDWGQKCGVDPRRPRDCNRLRYGSDTPPVYRLQDIPPTARIALFTGGQDRLADPLDVELLLESLPAGVVAARVHDPELEHLDYIWGQDAPERVYSRVVAMLQAEVVRLAEAPS